MTDYDRFFDTLFEDGASAEALAEAFNRAAKRNADKKAKEEKEKQKEAERKKKLEAARKKIDDSLVEYFVLLNPSFADKNHKEDYYKLMVPFFEEIEKEFDHTKKTKKSKSNYLFDDEFFKSLFK